LVLGLALLGLVTAATGAVAVKADLGKDATAGILSLKETGKAFAHVTKEVSPAVVYIKVEKRAPANSHAVQGQDWPQPFNDHWLKDFFGDRWPGHEFKAPEMPRGRDYSFGQGSGFIISDEGHILTNNHVVSGASKLTITLADGREFAGEIVGTDSRSDVAVVKIDAKDLPTLHMGNSDDVEVGEWVLAIGSPFGLPGTVTSGIVSAKGRSSVGITDYENFIQTDAAINPGNSGGPLVNLQGQVIGINTAILSRSGANNGIGFAIPINMARRICDQLIADGSVTRGYLGIMLQKLTHELAASFDLDKPHGVLIGDVTKDSPAYVAGLNSGDVVIEFDGKNVKDMGPFRNLVAATRPGSKVRIVVIRDGERKSFAMTLGRLPGAHGDESPAADSVESLGFRVNPLSDELRDHRDWNDLSGVVISHVEAGSRAALAGLQPGMLIEQVNRHEVQGMEEFRSLIDEAKETESLLLRVRQGEFSRFIVLSWKD